MVTTLVKFNKNQKVMKNKSIRKSIQKISVLFLFSAVIVINSSFEDTYTLNFNRFFLKESSSKKISNLLTLEYSITKFKAGSSGISEAKVSQQGGIFTWQRLLSNEGALSINKRTGNIDMQNSDPGEYIVEYKINNQKATVKIIVLI